MCLAIPTKIISLLDHNRARVAVGGVEREISVALVKDLKPGDYVIVHVGYALSKLDEEEAQRTLTLFEEMTENFHEHEAERS